MVAFAKAKNNRGFVEMQFAAVTFAQILPVNSPCGVEFTEVFALQEYSRFHTPFGR